MFLKINNVKPKKIKKRYHYGILTINSQKKTINNMIEVTLFFPEAKWENDNYDEVMNKLRFEKIKLPIIPQKGMSLVLDDFLDSLNLSINEKIIFLNATRNEELENEIEYQEYLEATNYWEWLNFEITNTLSAFFTLSTDFENTVGLYFTLISFETFAFSCFLSNESIVNILLSIIYLTYTLYTSLSSEKGK